MFKAIANLYKRGRIDKAGVLDAVAKGLITAEEYGRITGEAYAA